MQTGQQLNKPKIFRKASVRQRLLAGLVFLAAAVIFGILALAAAGKINLSLWFHPCGFKQQFNLPCPTCGVTTSSLAFAGGKIFKAFYIQPAGALLCCVLAVAGFLAFPIAVFGVYFGFLERFFTEVKVKHIIWVLIIVITAGWMVTLARTFRIDY